MFLGSSTHTLDDKGRFIIPARFRELIRADGGDVVILSRLDGGLFAYTLNGWKKRERRVQDMAKRGGNMRRFLRVFAGNAHECACDKQGRVLVPPGLRAYAGLEKEIVVVGVLDHFEIWSLENWEKENEAMEVDMQQAEVGNEIAELGL